MRKKMRRKVKTLALASAIAAGLFTAMPYTSADDDAFLEESFEDANAIQEAAAEQETAEPEQMPDEIKPLEKTTNTVMHIVVDGVQDVKEKDIKKLIKKTKEGEFYNKENVKADLDAIIKSGAVQSARARTLMSNGELYVIFEVKELADVTDVVISGNTLVNTEDIKTKLLTQPKRPFEKTNVDKDVALIKEMYDQKGYIAIVSDVNNNNGIVTFKILEAKIEGTRYSGNKRTKDWVIDKTVKKIIGEGDFLTVSALQNLYAGLMGTELFQEVEVKAEPGSAPNLVVLDINVTEAKTGQWNLGGGYSNQYKAQIVGGVSDNNVNGEAKRITFDFGVGKEKKTFDFGYVDPYFKKSDTIVHFEAFRHQKDVDTDNNKYDETRTGGTIGMIKPISKDKKTKFFADFTIDKVNIDFKDGNGNQGLTANTLTLGVVNDTRDNIADPQNGHVLKAGISTSQKFWGSSENYNKFFVEARKYTKLAARDVLAARFAFNYSPDTIPFSEQFTIGGADTVRGLDEDEQRGNKSVLASLELRHKFNDNLQGVVFVDAGKAWSDAVDNAMKVAYGVGMRIKTGLGMLRLDVAKANGESVKYMFGIGHSF